MEVKKRISYPLGMFDLFKGFGMIVIILSHILPHADVSEWIYNLIYLCLPCPMGAYFAISGFQFRPSISIRKSVKKHAKAYLPLYLHMAVGTVLIWLFTNPYQSLRYSMGFLLGNQAQLQIGSYTLAYIALGWFLLASLGASILMDVVLKIKSQSARITCIAVFAVIGICFELNSVTFFSINRVLQALPSMYIGYCMYSGDWLKKRDSTVKKALPYLLLAILIPSGLLFLYGPNWTILIRLIGEVVMGYVAICFSRDTVQYTSRVLEIFRKIGRYTPWIIVVHSVEILCIEWWVVAENLLQFIPSDNLLFVVLFGIKVCIIIPGCILMAKLDRLERQWKRKRRTQKRRPAL